MSEKLAELVGQDAIDEGMKPPEVQQGRVETAHAAAEFWRSVSPEGDHPDPHVGRYRDGVGVVEDGDEVKVGSDDDIANLVEYGSIHNKGYAPRAQTEEHFNHGGGA